MLTHPDSGDKEMGAAVKIVQFHGIW